MPLARPAYCTALAVAGFLSLSGCTPAVEVEEVPASSPPQLERPYKKGTPAEFPIRIREIAPDFYLLTGRGANSLAAKTTDGLILVDTKLMYPAAFDEVKQALVWKTGSDEIAVAFMTHHHADHTGGNIFALGVTGQLIGHATAGETLKTYKTKIAPVNPSQPTVTFDDEFRTDIGGMRVEAYYWGPAHTNGDIAVYFPDAKIVAVGDLIYGNGEIAVDMVDGRGSLLGMLARLDDILALDFEILIPGHGANVLTRDEVKLYRERLEEFVKRGTESVRRGVKPEELRAAMRSDDLGFRLVGHFWTNPKYIKPIYDELVDAAGEGSK